jgi:NAD-dependent dihydropyrimidine dehydrogenase PreA subunit
MDITKELSKELSTVRTLRRLHIKFDPNRCKGVWQCYEVCPVGCWTPNHKTRIVDFHDPERCIACGACVLQCPEGAIELSTDSEGDDRDSRVAD